MSKLAPEISAPPSSIRPAKAPFAAAVLMCRKCKGKLGADGKSIRKGLKRALKSGRWGKGRLVETGCFSLCPKRRQVLASQRTLGERRLLVVDAGSSLEEALEYLLGPPGRSV